MGVPTFLFSDIEGSTRLLEQLGDRYADVLARHWAVLRESCAAGEEFGAEGDAMFFSFDDPAAAVEAAVAAQRALRGTDWPAAATVRVRMAIHAGEARRALGTWLGVPVHHTARACAAGHGGQVIVTEAVVAALVDRVPPGVELRDLGAYRLRDIAGDQRLSQVVAGGLDEQFPPLRTPSVAVTNLPDQVTTFVGRAEEIGALRHALDTSRLVTVVGFGGAGKTRLALEVAGAAGPSFADGAWLVELADLPAGGDVAAAVARVIGIAEDGTEPLETRLVAALSPRHSLLVLDNCEHVVDGAARLVARVLRAAPEVRVLATSREALDVPGEQAWPVPPLRLPARDEVDAEAVGAAEAVRLFVDRAAAARPDVDLGNDPVVVRTIAEVCRRLDGIPLAIELAAARTSVLSPDQILERLDDRFQLLTRGRRAALGRQQTLRALVDWSHDLLDESERRVFRRLGVFAGSFDLDAVAAVADVDDGVDLLDSLVRKSLTVAGFPGAGPPRFWLLETLRAYALEALGSYGDEVAARDAHASHYKRLAEDAGAAVLGPDQVDALDRLERDVDNLRAAIEWLVVTAPDDALGVAGALGPFFGIRSRLREGRELLDRALAATPREPSFPRLRALAAAGTITRIQGDFATARARHAEQLELAQEQGDEDEVARALSSLGNVALIEGDAVAARPLFERSLEIRRRSGAPSRAVAMSLNNLGALADAEGDWETAERCYREHLGIMRELGDRRVAAQTLTNLANVAAAQERWDEARALLSESIEGLRSVGDTRSVAVTLAAQASVARRTGDGAAALSMYADALRVLDEIGDAVGIATALEGIAATIVERDATTAAFLLGVAAQLPAGRAERGAAADESAAFAERIARSALGATSYEAAFANGVDGDLRAGIARALEAGR